MNYATDSAWLLFCMVFTLGLRHGFDLDHLATIDSITRTVKENPRLSKWVGFLFSFGHGLVVIAMCLIIGGGFIQIRSPRWLEACGHWISIAFLLLFGSLTLWNSLAKSTQYSAEFKGFFLRKIMGEKYHPCLIVVIGALFAFSFDTFTQVALFSISASVLAGYFFTVVLGIVFMLGMMTSDGLNGLFVSKIIQSADKKSMIISRGFGLLIASFSIILGVIGVVNQMD